MSEYVRGTGAGDVMTGNDEPDGFAGLGGNDSIAGSGGDDDLVGGSGSSTPSNRSILTASDYAGSVTFMGETASHRNTIGMYEIAADGTISGVRVLFANASLQGSDGNLVAGTSAAATLFEAGAKYGFFIVPNGYTSVMNRPGSYQLRPAGGGIANVNGTAKLELWHINAATDVATRIKGANDGQTFHSTGAAGEGINLNGDGIDHSQIRVDPASGSVVIAFEDLLGGGDNDFDDAVIRIDMGAANAAKLSGLDRFGCNEDDSISGGGGNDIVRGGKGRDLLYGDDGADSVSGDTGNDRVWGGSGDDSVSGGLDDDRIWGGAGNDAITGGKHADTLWGESGDDRMKGDGGNDDISGGDGADRMVGGDGNDTVRADGGDDEGDGGKGNDAIWGGAGNDTCKGGSGNDSLFDEAGDDSFGGGAGEDRIVAGGGDDFYEGGSGVDTLDFSSYTTGLVIDLKAGTATGASGSDRLKSFETVFGSNGADTITGNAADNTIAGRQGSDSLAGGKGKDTFAWSQKDVTGDKGKDAFVDAILDFGGGDKLDLRALPDLRDGVALANLAQLREAGGDTIVSAAFGPSGAFVDVAILDSVTGLDLATLYADGILLV